MVRLFRYGSVSHGKWLAVVFCAPAILIASCGSTAQWSQVHGEPSIDGPGSADGLSDGLANAGPEKVIEGLESTRPAGEHPIGSVTSKNLPGISSTDRKATSSHGAKSVRESGAATGKGYTQNDIYIGYATFKGAESYTRTVGLSRQYGDQEGYARAAVSEINANGGIFGRKISLVFYDYKSEQGQIANSQAACVKWTEDNPVFAVISNTRAFDDDTLVSCLAKRSTPIAAAGLRPERAYLRSRPYLYAPTEPTFERLVPVWMERLSALGYFEGGWDIDHASPGREPTRVGILSVRSTYGTDFARITREALSRQGLSVAAAYEVKNFDDQGGFNQAVVRFRSANVTHIINHINLGYFMISAESQNYRPRYAIISSNTPETLQSVMPAAQLTGSMGVGHLPSYDVDNARDPGDISNAESKCVAVMRKHGYDPANRTALPLMYGACDGLYFFKKVVEAGGLSPGGVYAGTNRVKSMEAADTFSVAFRGGRHDGAGAVRDLAYKDTCKCFMYLSAKNRGM